VIRRAIGTCESTKTTHVAITYVEIDTANTSNTHRSKACSIASSGIRCILEWLTMVVSLLMVGY